MKVSTNARRARPLALPLTLSLSLMLALIACAPITPMSDGTPVPDAVGPEQVLNLDQGWDEATQMAFWFSTQGSRIVPYPWFLALEQAGNSQPFRSNANIERLGYLPAKPGPGRWNPDGLPVGFAQTQGPQTQAWLGLTCAACHTSQVNLRGVGLRIDGGPSMADFNLFFRELVAALEATWADAAKFERFAKAVLGPGASETQKQALRLALGQQAKDSRQRLTLNTPSFPAGHARLDAFGNIFNEVLVVALQQPGNAQAPDAPVSYPFIWDTPQHDKVQWNGSAPNGPFGLGELTRNVGEVLGVFGGLGVNDCGKDRCRYPNHVDIRQLGQLEGWVRSLWSPQWYEKALGPLDASLVQRGQQIYQNQCISCHAVIDRKDPFRRITAQMRDVGTDPAMATAAAMRMAKTGPLQGTLAFPSFQRYGAEAGGGALTVQAATGVLFGDLDATLAALISQYEAQLQDELRGSAAQRNARPATPRPSAELLQQVLNPKAQPAAAQAAAAEASPAPTPNAIYKARPLNGIWATAPYLHNGSVPTLWDLLQPVEQRPRQFQVGSREFDPQRVGFDTARGPSRFDTRLPGNSNSGHLFGTTLDEAQKRALLEYLKSL
ncbi:di-heme-cytochrome C peroxidase [Kinneretia aquatilis]|uniref:di-heme-cytochrome C peroxidase n=1 Tax=Kinneretia aquatilis TaxID=2070761 RepID=UPI0014951839|nr:di-heme-cytochrome C peroxidase [Paucibacter aquatile]WIV99073.1 di-heme-cytochrome C peroxidase [Paucibacter aquatile]